MSDNNLQIFSGFNVSYPEFEVLTPQRKQTFTVRSMTVSEEEVLKGSILTPITVSKHLAEVLWNCIIKKPDYIKSYDDFINNVTLRDRDCLLYGLYVSTYKTTQSFSFNCSKCSFKNKVKIDMEKGFNFKMWDNDKDCLETKNPVNLEILNGVQCILRVPTIKDEIDLSEKNINLTEEENSLSNELLMVDSFRLPDTKEKVKKEDGSEVEEVKENYVSDRNKIMEAYKMLPSYDRKLITKSYYEKYDQYRIGVSATNTCRCGHEQTINIDVTRQFFLALY